MRLALTVVLVLASAATLQAAPVEGVITPAGSILLHRHPLPWRPSAQTVASGFGLRFEPENPSDEALAMPMSSLRTLAQSHRAELARVPVMSRADGSRYAVLGGLVRSYTIATIGPDGRLTQDCVHSEQEALDCVDAASPTSHEEN